MKLFVAIAISAFILAGQAPRPAQLSVTAVRHWTLTDVTRVAIEVSGEFQYHTDRLHDPERVYFDILNSRPRLGVRRGPTDVTGDKLLTKVRIAETLPGVTRIVLDLSDRVDATTSQLSNPDRLIIELRAKSITPTETPATTPTPSETAPVRVPPPSVAPKLPPPAIKADTTKVDAPPKALIRQDPTLADQITQEPAKTQVAKLDPPKPEPPKADVSKPDPPKVAKAEPPKIEPAKIEAAKPEPLTPPRTAPSALALAETGKAARRTTNGDTSLVRALGLKIGRVVIDPGHGGHDQGTQGPKGLLEKDLVLDVALRVGKLIEDKMGADVIYTRTDDTFIPLEGRTALANEKKADLFLSIHANSSPVPRIAGMETFYLNFTDSKDAMDVASRENASSQKSVFELRDLIQKITLHDKAEESRDFAGRMQSSLYALSAKYFPGLKNRGVKKAPFVVLIGANMPSILAEIGFLSNTREETLLKRPDYRQKLAEALFRGVQRYADSLSHFQVAQAKD
jgi:N-acetylmuramoyl-L-alanine amidase